MTLVAPNQNAMNSTADQDVVLSVQGVSKKFCRDFKRALFYGMQDISSEVMGLRGDKNTQLRKKEFWALQDVSFELRRGEALGLVGKNGSGKSTLLRIIAGLIKPDVGSVEVRGRVAPLIALGAGFNPVLTGRENIYANMSILGLSKAEIDERFDEVVEFAEIPDAIDSPVRSYSSGMQARLGFACAVHTSPEILLIDEALAVGDLRFVAKCHRRLQELREQGVSFVMVSHHSHHIMNVCDSAIYIKKGELVAIGEVAKVINQYETDLFQLFPNPKNKGLIKVESTEVSSATIESVYLKNQNGELVNDLITEEDIKICVVLSAKEAVDSLNIYFCIRKVSGGDEFILHISNFFDKKSFPVNQGTHEITLQMEHLGLNPGSYDMQIFLKNGSISTTDIVKSFPFNVKNNGKLSRGLFSQKHSWTVETIQQFDHTFFQE